MFRKSLHLSLIFILAVSAVAQQQRAESVPSIERVRAHITYLASDKLQGRRTGTAEAMEAANYIAREFARDGLRRTNGVDRPGMSIVEADSPRRYMQEFPFVANVALGKGNMLKVGTTALRVGEDWMPLGFSANASVKDSPVLFVGYGITDAEQNYDDYKIIRNGGGIAIALSGTPDGDNPHGKFARTGELRFKVAAARAAGARALLIVASDDNFKNERLTSLKYDNAGGEAGLPVAVISRQAAAKIIGTSDFAGLEKELAAVRPPGDGSLRNIDILRLPIKGLTINLTTDVVRKDAPAANVVGILEGTDPQIRKTGAQASLYHASDVFSTSYRAYVGALLCLGGYQQA